MCVSLQVSLDNYVEMRSKTASPLFTLKRNVDWILSDISDTLPSLFSWIPLYTMVTFTRIPYHKAIEKAKAQDRVLACALAGSVSAALAASLFAARRFLSRA
jgi:kynurenine 3-monooxygenase